MMTIREVPTRTPIPTVEMSCSRDCDMVKDRGNEPARKDLRDISDKQLEHGERVGIRNCHDCAQSEQHEQTV